LSLLFWHSVPATTGISCNDIWCDPARLRAVLRSELSSSQSAFGWASDTLESVNNTKLDDAVARAFYVERFDDFLALEQGASVQTSRAYKLDIARFVGYANVKGAKSPIDVGARTLREYVYHLKDLGLSAASIRRNVSAVRTDFQ